MYIADISGHNKNFGSIIDGEDGVIVKISEGLNYINPLANDQIAKAKASGKPWGIYHFIIGGLDVRAQADYFYNNAKNYADEQGVVLVLDFERPQGYPALSGNEPKVFFDRIRELTGKNGMLYIGHADMISGAYNWSDINNDIPFWVAGYPINNGSGYTQDLQNWADKHYFHHPAYNGINVAMWQFDSVPYDQSVWYGSKEAWYVQGSRIGTAPKPAPQPTPAVAAVEQPTPAPQPEAPKNEATTNTKKAGADVMLFKANGNTKFGNADAVYEVIDGKVFPVENLDQFNYLRGAGVLFLEQSVEQTEKMIIAFGGLN